MSSIYNEVRGDPDVSDSDRSLAEDMLRMSSVREAEERWQIFPDFPA